VRRSGGAAARSEQENFCPAARIYDFESPEQKKNKSLIFPLLFCSFHASVVLTNHSGISKETRYGCTQFSTKKAFNGG
jgi:hypothetical protein